MHKFGLILAAYATVAALAMGQQLDSNSITVSASRNIASVQPDQVVFSVLVDAPPNAGFNDILAAVQSLGLTSANFSSVNTSQTQQAQLNLPPNVILPVEWGFNLPIPVSKVKDAIAALTSVQRSIGQNNSGFTLSFRVQNTQVSQQLQQSQPCSVSDLLADARAQAQKLADAAGLNLGAALSISGATANNVAAAALGLYSVPQICSLTVKFAASRY